MKSPPCLVALPQDQPEQVELALLNQEGLLLAALPACLPAPHPSPARLFPCPLLFPIHSQSVPGPAGAATAAAAAEAALRELRRYVGSCCSGPAGGRSRRKKRKRRRLITGSGGAWEGLFHLPRGCSGEIKSSSPERTVEHPRQEHVTEDGSLRPAGGSQGVQWSLGSYAEVTAQVSGSFLQPVSSEVRGSGLPAFGSHFSGMDHSPY
uniref:Uncharacterized protein LOC110208001 n=1 Tax=Phascolarctos cinereus TaxID=38626 RepID=A0A6P5K802_PHACI|nr:uncharacterized protein LOC110208001 [Phascolarctos cinereus]